MYLSDNFLPEAWLDLYGSASDRHYRNAPVPLLTAPDIQHYIHHVKRNPHKEYINYDVEALMAWRNVQDRMLIIYLISVI